MSDLVTFGEAMLRLSPPDDERLEDAAAFEVRAAGAESNVAIAAQRLGTPATWLSKAPETPLGRRAVGDVRKHGIDTDVVWSHLGRQGTYYLEHAGRPRGTNVIYDRENSAMATAKPRDFDFDPIANARLFFTSGVTLALSSSVRDTTASMFKAAQRGDTTTAFAVDYRRELWSADEAEAMLTHLFPGVDILIIAASDARTVLGFEGDPRQLAHKLGSQYDFRTVAVTRGDQGAIAWHDSVVHAHEGYETDAVAPIGADDAFTGAFLARRLQGDDVPTALEYATAAAALKRTIPGDVALVTPSEVESVVRNGELAESR